MLFLLLCLLTGLQANWFFSLLKSCDLWECKVNSVGEATVMAKFSAGLEPYGAPPQIEKILNNFLGMGWGVGEK